jgi:hypothetical protein
MVSLAATAAGVETGGLDNPMAAARAALAAMDAADPDLVPCVYTVCGEILLHEGAREEATAAFLEALADPGIAPDWRARAEAGIREAEQAVADTEDTEQTEGSPAQCQGGEAKGED